MGEGYKNGGLKNKYIIKKTNGQPVSPEAQYFVLRLDKDPHAVKAALAYADSVEIDNPALAFQLRGLAMQCKNLQIIKNEIMNDKKNGG